MLLRTFLCFFLLSNLLYGQDKVYETYNAETGIAIHTVYNWMYSNEIKVHIQSADFELTDLVHSREKEKPWDHIYARFCEGGKMGILNLEGKIMVPAVYDTIQRCDRWVGEGMPLVADFFILKKDQCAWVKRISDLTDFFPESYDSVFYDYYAGDLRCFERDRVRYFCNNGLQLFPDIRFESISQAYFEVHNWERCLVPSKMIAKEPGKPMSVYSTDPDKPFVNKEAATLIRFLPETDENTSRLLVFASKNGKMGLLDELGNIRVPFVFDSLIVLYDWYRSYGIDRLITIRDGKEGLCDFHNQCIHPTEYLAGSFSENESYYNETFFIVSKDSTEFQGVLDVYGKEIIPVSEQTIEEHTHNGHYEQQFFYVTRNGKMGLYNFEGKEVIPCKYHSVYDVNATDDYAEEPRFLTFDTEEARYNYWISR